MSQAAGFFTNSGPGGFVQTLTGNTGGPIPPLAGNINVVGDGTTITVAGNAGTHTLTISAIGSGLVSSLTTDDGHVVTPTAGTIILHGTHGLNTTGTIGPNTATVAINNAITLGDLVALGAGVGAVTLTTGDLIVTAGNIQMPNTNTTGTRGVYEVGGFPFLHSGGPVNGAVGPDNVFLGGSAGIFNTPGVFNVGVGRQSLQNVTGDNNLAIGALSGSSIGAATQCVAIGSDSLSSLTTGSNVIAIGYRAGFSLAGAESNDIYIGTMGVVAESNTIRIGTNAVQTATYIVGIDGVDLNTATVVTENSDQLGTAVITGAGGISINVSPNQIEIDGSGVASSIVLTGNSGTATGPAINVIAATTEGSSLITGDNVSTLTLTVTDVDFNVVLGTSAFESTRTVGVATANVGVGWHVLNSITTGGGNLALGFDSLVSVDAGSQNLGLGVNALNSLTSGSNNVAISAGINSLVSGSYNIAIGDNSGSTYTTNESSNILINNVGVIGESNKLRIGTNGSGASQVNATYIAGIDGVNVGSVAKVVTMASDQLGTSTITAGAGITVTPGVNTITIASIGSGLTWSVITANQTAAVENGYFCNKAGTLALALPATSAVGDVIEVTNENTALGVQFTQAAGQQILIGNTNTTLGATGTLTSSAVGDTLKIVCKVANTIWRVTSIVGNWTPA